MNFHHQQFIRFNFIYNRNYKLIFRFAPRAYEIPKNGGKFGIPKISYEIPKKWEKIWSSKNHMKFQIMREKNGFFVYFSLIGPISNHLSINFEKILCSKETSYQNSKKPYGIGIVIIYAVLG